jgi:hypothetical protein
MGLMEAGRSVLAVELNDFGVASKRVYIANGLFLGHLSVLFYAI